MNTLTDERIAHAIGTTNDFLYEANSTNLQGNEIGREFAARIETVEDRAEALLLQQPHPKWDGFYVPLSAKNANYFDEAVHVLPGYFVLVPSVMVDRGTSHMYPAVVSEDSKKLGALRLHVLRQPYRRGLMSTTDTIMSGIGQTEAQGVGVHGHAGGDAIEPEHFATLVAAGSDHEVRTLWQRGKHINHTWRKQPNTSVSAELSKRVLGGVAPESTLTITREQIAQRRAVLYWHNGMQQETAATDARGREVTKVRVSAARDPRGLVALQGVGFAELRQQNPKAVDQVKRMVKA